MNNSWHLGRFAGIDVRIHWTFLLLPIWIYFSQMAAGSGTLAAVVAVLFVLAIFACVVLHEYGHALTARHYGIHTRDITLLPIGGVASLERMPRNPRQELAIAVAGPAVNVVIATLLVVGLTILGGSSVLPIAVADFLFDLAWVNGALVVFNMIPAFPMDGGRVLRAILAMALPYSKATRVAVGVGRVAAVALGFLGIMTGNLILVLVAGFVFLAGSAELAMQTAGAERVARSSKATLLDARGNVIGAIPASPLPVISDQWDAGNALGQLSGVLEDEFLVSRHGEAVAIVRTHDLQTVVQNGLGSIPLERLLISRLLPYREVHPGTAA
ncbi:site-2 protease family protein [Aporhodopirellula aestuarii]|uniref:Site-2 protease family protein n=1 Tax=Aporhodopirellula aestuarii TaxID=2950107 RepID=A0ABT0UAS3_9BACT|nr:site-2 protease family protein [Aporhodopirellula aestuarii]MCM2374104.1 site-2 protease family protein [Aporhodopirellula aestuarii]